MPILAVGRPASACNCCNDCCYYTRMQMMKMFAPQRTRKWELINSKKKQTIMTRTRERLSKLHHNRVNSEPQVFFSSSCFLLAIETRTRVTLSKPTAIAWRQTHVLSHVKQKKMLDFIWVTPMQLVVAIASIARGTADGILSHEWRKICKWLINSVVQMKMSKSSMNFNTPIPMDFVGGFYDVCSKFYSKEC